jgi:hypothetical protein
VLPFRGLAGEGDGAVPLGLRPGRLARFARRQAVQQRDALVDLRHLVLEARELVLELALADEQPTAVALKLCALGGGCALQAAGDAVVRPGVIEGEFRWHKLDERTTSSSSSSDSCCSAWRTMRPWR